MRHRHTTQFGRLAAAADDDELPRRGVTARIYRARPAANPGTVYRPRRIHGARRDRLAAAGVAVLLAVEIAVACWIVAGGAEVIAHLLGQP